MLLLFPFDCPDSSLLFPFLPLPHPSLHPSFLKDFTSQPVQSLYKLLLQGPRTINSQQEQHPEDMMKMVMNEKRPREAEDQPFLLMAAFQPRGTR